MCERVFVCEYGGHCHSQTHTIHVPFNSFYDGSTLQPFEYLPEEIYMIYLLKVAKTQTEKEEEVIRPKTKPKTML